MTVMFVRAGEGVWGWRVSHRWRTNAVTVRADNVHRGGLDLRHIGMPRCLARWSNVVGFVGCIQGVETWLTLPTGSACIQGGQDMHSIPVRRYNQDSLQ